MQVVNNLVPFKISLYKKYLLWHIRYGGTLAFALHDIFTDIRGSQTLIANDIVDP